MTTLLKTLILTLLPLSVLVACGGEDVPAQYRQLRELPKIYPDYVGVTIPANMAPLRFELLAGGDDAVVRFSAGGESVVCHGLKARPAIEPWRRLTSAALAQGKATQADGAVTVEVFAENADEWVRFQPFTIHVSPDTINPWLTFRLISPSYVSYEELTLNERCLETFDERVIVDNMLCSTEAGGQCVNCHSFQQYNPRRRQFHARQTHGGTFIDYDGKAETVSITGDSLLSSPVYPAWHPTLPLIAYSTNKTMQSFYTRDPDKIEVIDALSDLVLYDVVSHQTTPVENRRDELETYPCWAPDGRTLYFCSAHFEYPGGQVDEAEITLRAKTLKYNIYRKTFDPATRQFGPRELVFRADTMTATASGTAADSTALGMSATLPRLSPDGRWLLFTLGGWGCFHIWHHDADLWLMDLQNGVARPLEECNSADTESYHTWAANSRWVVFSSRRYDGVFTRPFIAHISPDGKGSKPFELPASDPDYHRQLLKSYNVPELADGPVGLSPQAHARILKIGGK